MLKVLHGTIAANKEPLFLRVFLSTESLNTSMSIYKNIFASSAWLIELSETQ